MQHFGVGGGGWGGVEQEHRYPSRLIKSLVVSTENVLALPCALNSQQQCPYSFTINARSSLVGRHPGSFASNSENQEPSLRHTPNAFTQFLRPWKQATSTLQEKKRVFRDVEELDAGPSRPPPPLRALFRGRLFSSSPGGRGS